MSTDSDAVYYEASGGIASRLAVLARRRMFSLFMNEMRPGPQDELLDVGVSDVETAEANIWEKHYPWPAQITAAGIGNGRGFTGTHKAARYVAITPRAALPFAHNAFDFVLSNAVLEHVGSAADRRAFLSELLRVGRRCFVTIPYRWFPVEHHTALPLLHYAPSLFRAFCRRSGRDYWADPMHLEFLDERKIRGEWSFDRPVRLIRTGLPLGPFASNLALIVSS